MQWGKRGAHLLLQTRVKTLNGELGAVFQRWYPDLQAGGGAPGSLSPTVLMLSSGVPFPLRPRLCLSPPCSCLMDERRIPYISQ